MSSRYPGRVVWCPRSGWLDTPCACHGYSVTSSNVCPMTGRSATACLTPDDHSRCPDLRKESGYE